MRRIILMAVASSAFALAAPGVASAHHARHHSRTHHARKARFRHFGAFSRTTTSTTSPTTPATPAGTVKSFNEGVLTITLADSSTVSGKVNEDTEIICVTPGTENGGDDDQGSGDDQGGDHAGAFASDFHGDQGDDDQGDDDGGGATNCTVAALVPGAVVLGAELRIGSSGAVWDRVALSS